jgi:hypothetical protein
MSESRFRSRRIAPAAVFLALSASASAQETALATLSANLGSLAKLTVSSTTLSFPDADPDLVPQVPSSPPVVAISAKARTPRLGTVTLTVIATDDLRAGVTTIPVSDISWTSSGAGFVNGSLNRAVPQVVASWTGSGVRMGTQEYVFANRWTHPTGTFSLTITYTLSAP